MQAQVLPFPLVPATWTNFIFFSGWPSFSNSTFTRSKPGLKP